MNKETGGPAFPRPASAAHQHGMHKPQDGMTLRDYFAAQAMQALIEKRADWQYMQQSISDYSYKQADEMLKARKK